MLVYSNSIFGDYVLFSHNLFYIVMTLGNKNKPRIDILDLKYKSKNILRATSIEFKDYMQVLTKPEF